MKILTAFPASLPKKPFFGGQEMLGTCVCCKCPLQVRGLLVLEGMEGLSLPGWPSAATGARGEDERFTMTSTRISAFESARRGEAA